MKNIVRVINNIPPSLKKIIFSDEIENIDEIKKICKELKVFYYTM
jgi:hypothetical protein